MSSGVKELICGWSSRATLRSRLMRDTMSTIAGSSLAGAEVTTGRSTSETCVQPARAHAAAQTQRFIRYLPAFSNSY
jgi:hypothetical protein